MSIRSLIVKVGAKTEEIDRALERLGSNAKKTDADLKKLGNAPLAQQAQKSFAAMTDAMNGITKAQERVAERAKQTAAGLDQIGGAARLTKTELDQVNRTLQNGLDAYRALGQQAPKDLEKVAAAVIKQRQALDGAKSSTSLFSQAQGLLFSKLTAVAGPAALGLVVKQSLDYADSITKLSDRTGIGVVQLQRLDAVAAASGNSVEEVANAVNAFQKRLVGGDADDAINRIGLSVEKLRSLSPDEQFFEIAKAIQQIPDPAEQSATAMELFGKSGAQLLPTLKSDIDGLKDSTVKMSAETVRTLDDAGDAFGRFKTGAVNVLGEITAGAIQLLVQLGRIPGALADAGKTPVPNQIAVPDMLVGDAVSPELKQQLTPQQLAQLVRGEAAILPKSPGSAFGAPAGPLPIPNDVEMIKILDTLERQRDAMNEATKRAASFKAAMNELDSAAGKSDVILRRMNGTVVEAVKFYLKAGVSQSALATAYGLTDVEVKAVAASIDDEARSVKALADLAAGSGRDVAAAIGQIGSDAVRLGQERAFVKVIDNLQEIDKTSRGIPGNLKDIGIQLPPIDAGVQAIVDSHERWKNAIGDLAGGFATLAQASGGAFGGIAAEIGNIIGSLNLATKAADNFAAARAKGDKAGAAASLVSGVAAVAQATSSGSTLGRAAGGALAGAQLGSVIPGVGTLAGGLIGGGVGLVRGLFGGNDPEKQINPQREAFVQSFRTVDANGIAEGFDVLNKKANDAGVTLNRLLNAKNPKQYQAAIDELNVAFARQAQRVELVDSSVSGLAAAVGAAGGRMPKDLRETIDSLSRMEGLSEANRKAISELAKGAEPDMNALQKRASEFGITLQQLGPKFQQADVDTRAKSIADLFADLTQAGGDAGGVIAGLSDEINTLVADTRKFGGELPESMKPLLENMLRYGQLTDEQGEKLKDLTGIKFKETPLDKGTNAIVDAIKELKEALIGLPKTAVESAQGIQGAFDRNRLRIGVDIDYNDPGFTPSPLVPDQAATGGIVTPRGIQHFATGGRVLPFLRRGTDTVPAMLTPGEIVLNAAQQRAVAASIGSGGGSVVVNVSVNGYIDSPAAQRNLARIVQAQLTKAVQDRKKVGVA